MSLYVPQSHIEKLIKEAVDSALDQQKAMIERQSRLISELNDNVRQLRTENDKLHKKLDRLGPAGQFYLDMQALILRHPEMLMPQWESMLSMLKLCEPDAEKMIGTGKLDSEDDK